jgi:hypothetical protein
MQQMLQMARVFVISAKMLEITRAVKRGYTVCLTTANLTFI